MAWHTSCVSQIQYQTACRCTEKTPTVFYVGLRERTVMLAQSGRSGRMGGDRRRGQLRGLAGVRFHHWTRDRNGCYFPMSNASFCCHSAQKRISCLALPAASTGAILLAKRSAVFLALPLLSSGRHSTLKKEISVIKIAPGRTSTNQHVGRRSQQVLGVSIPVTMPSPVAWQVDRKLHN